MKYTTEIFIEKARKVHGDKYDYSKVKYVDAYTEVKIICPIHGEFLQKPTVHINQKCGCRECGYESVKEKNSSSLDLFIEKARKVHGDKYDYSKVKYINNTKEVCIVCPIHGEFFMKPSNHLNGNGCRKCSNEKLSKERMLSTDEWIKKAIEVHGQRYSYTNTIYRGYDKKLTITCPKHGDFEQIAYDHIQGKGCPKCRKSKLEIEVGNFLDIKGIKYEDGIRPKFLSKDKSHLSLDFYLPKYNAAIECQGKQHFEDGTFYDNRKETIKERDIRKYELCKGNLKLYYYSNLKIDKYLGKVYNDKEELLKSIIADYEKELL